MGKKQAVVKIRWIFHDDDDDDDDDNNNNDNNHPD